MWRDSYAVFSAHYRYVDDSGVGWDSYAVFSAYYRYVEDSGVGWDSYSSLSFISVKEITLIEKFILIQPTKRKIDKKKQNVQKWIGFHQCQSKS